MSNQREPTQDQLERLCTALRRGLDVRAAADRAGVLPEIVYQWIARGERDVTGPCRSLADEVQRAELAQAHLHG